jgi:hypothetical protein
MINPLAVARMMMATDADQGIDNNSNNSELVTGDNVRQAPSFPKARSRIPQEIPKWK